MFSSDLGRDSSFNQQIETGESIQSLFKYIFPQENGITLIQFNLSHNMNLVLYFILYKTQIYLIHN
jgi:hypothetical protein